MPMQKIWRQIGFSYTDLNFFERFMQENKCKNYSEAIVELFKQYKRYQIIMKELEKKANEAEMWKERANRNIEQRVNNAMEELKNE